MVRNLLVERFKLQTHMEERPINALIPYLSAKPKMKPADPNGRIKCDEGPGLGQKDVRDTRPILGRLLNCQNMTMARFRRYVARIEVARLYSCACSGRQATGLEGSWDFSLSFSALGQL